MENIPLKPIDQPNIDHENPVVSEVVNDGSIDRLSSVSQKILENQPNIGSAKRLELHDIESVGGKLGKRVDYYERFTPTGGAGSSVLGFFKSISVKIANLLTIGPKHLRKAEVNHGLLSGVLRASNVEQECPRTVAFDYMKQFYSSQPDGESKAMAEQLSYTAKLSGRLDRLQKTPNLKSDDKRLGEITKSMTRHVEALQEGDKMLVPGGWWSEGKFHDGLIEVTKQKDDHYTVRFISTDQEIHQYSPRVVDPLTNKVAVCPHFTYENVTKEQVNASLSPLIQMQIPSLVEDKPEKLGWKDKLINFLVEKVTGEKGDEITEKLEESEASSLVNPLFVMSAYYNRREPTISQADVDQALDVEQRLGASASGNTVKNVLTFYKLRQPHLYQSAKLQLQISTFVELTERCDGVLDNANLRRAVSDSARRLRHELGKQRAAHLISPEAMTFLLDKISKVQDRVAEMELTAATSPKAMKEWNLSPPSGSVQSDAFAQLTPVEPTKVSSVGRQPEVVDCSGFFADPIDGAQLSGQLAVRLEACQKLYDSGNFQVLQNLVVDTALKLPLVTEFQAPDRESAEAAKLEQQFCTLTQYLFEINLATDPEETPFDAVLAATKLDTLIDQVCLEENYVSKIASRFISDKYPAAHFGTGQIDFIQHREDIAALEGYWQARAAPKKGGVNYPHIIKEAASKGGVERRSRVERMFETERMNLTLVSNRKPLRLRKEKNEESGKVSLPAKPLPLGKEGHRQLHKINVKVAKDFVEPVWELQLDALYMIESPFVKASSGQYMQDLSFDIEVYGKKQGKPPLSFDANISISDKSGAGSKTEGEIMNSYDDPVQVNLLLCQVRGMEVSRTVNTFLGHPEYFDDPSLVGFFEQKVLIGSALKGEILRNPAILNQLGESFQREYQLALQSGNILRAGTLLEVGIKIRNVIQADFGNDSPMANRIRNDIPGLTEWETTKEALQTVRSKAITSEEKTFATMQQLAWTSRAWKAGLIQKADLPVKDLIEGYFIVSSGPRTKHTADKGMRAESDSLLQRLSSDLPKMNQADRQDLVNRLLTNAKIPVPQNTTINGSYPIWQVGDYQIDFEKGLIFKKGGAVGSLSDQTVREVKNLPLAATLWTKPLATNGVMELGRASDNSEVTFFTPHSHPELRLVMQQGATTRIQRKVVDSKGKETFYDLVSLGATPPINSLLESCTVWVNPADKTRAVAVPRAGSEPTYELIFKSDEKGNPSIDSVKRLKDGLTLMTLPEALSSDPEYGQLFSLEAPEHTVLWGNGSKPLSVEYPRLKMSDGKPLSYKITQESVNGKTRPTLEPEVPQLQGGKVDLMGNVIKGAEGILPPTFQQFQLLQSPKGNPKVVFTLQKLLPYDPDKLSNVIRGANATTWLNRAYFDRAQESTRSQKTVIAEMDIQSKKLQTTSKESMAMVAYVFFAHKDYEQAADYLNKSIAASALTKDHKNVLQWIIDWPDPNPEGAAFKLKAAIALVESEQKHGNPASVDLTQLSDLLQNYRLNEENIPVSLKLSEEQLSISHKISQSYQEEGELLLDAKPVKDSTTETMPSSEAAMTFYMNAAKQESFHPQPIPINSDKFLEEHFVSMYEWLWASKNQGKKGTVVASLEGCRPKTPLGESLRRYLLVAAKSADAPAFPKEYNKQGLFDGFAPVRLLKIAKAGEEQPPALAALSDFFRQVEAKVIAPVQAPGRDSIAEPSRVPERFEKLQALDAPDDAEEIISEYLESHPVPDVTPMAFTAAQKSESRVLSVAEPPGLFTISSAASRSELNLSGLKKASDAGTPTERLVDEAIADTIEYRKTPLAAAYQLNNSAAVAKLSTDVNQALNSATNARKEVEKSILDQLNIKIQSKGIASTQAEKLTKIPDRLFGLYAQNKMVDIGTALGARMSPEEAATIDTLMETYMTSAIQERLLSQLSQRLESVPPNPADASETLVTDIKNLLSTKRYYSLEQGGARHPLARKLLVIENGSFVLRQGQVRTHEALFSGENRLRQLAMGGGKTLLMPTLLDEYADGFHLAEAILPEWLEEITGNELDNVCGSIYGQHLHRFKYNEEKADDVQWLNQELLTLQQTIKNRGAVLTTRTHKLSFRNKYLEALQTYNETRNPKDWEKLQALGSIVNLFSTRARTIADEVDSTLDVRQKCIRAEGVEKPLPIQLSNTSVELFKKLDAWTDKESGVPEKLRNFALAVRSNRQAELYEESGPQIKEALAGDIYTDWSSKWPEEVTVSKEDFTKYLMGDTSKELKAKLGVNAKGIPLFMQKLQRGNPEEYRKVCYAKRFISKTLDSTFTLSNNVRYGRGEDGVTTRPYLAVNKPTSDKFGNRYEEVLLHCQDYLQTGLNETQVGQFLDDIRKNLDTELNNARLEGIVLKAEDTKIYEQFYSNPTFQQIDLTRALRDPAEAKRLQEVINGSLPAKLEFALKWVLPNIKATSRQISSGPFDLVQMSKKFTGFSGTPWNPDVYSKKLDKSEINDIGTDGKTIDFLLSAAKNGQLNVRILDKFDDSKPVESIVNQDGFWDRYDTLIDAGAYIRGPTNDEVAKILGENVQGTKKTAVAFVDNEDKLALQDFGSDVKVSLADRKDVPVENRFNFYAQANSIGTDMPNGAKARAAITLGEDTTFFKGAQAMWRMRGLSAEGQQLDILLKEEVAALIRPEGGPVTAADVVHFMLQKQAEREAKDNFSAETERIQGIIPNHIFSEILASVAEGKKPTQEMLDLANEHLYSNLGEDLDELAQIGDSEAAIDNLETLKQKQIDLCTDIEKALGKEPEFLKDAKKELQEYEVLAANKLPKEVDAAAASNEGAVIQQQQQQQQQQQVQASQAVAKGAPIETSWRRWPFRLHFPPSGERGYGDIMEPNSISSEAKWMDKDISYSKNFAAGFDDLLKPNRKQLNRLVIFSTPDGKTQALMIDLMDLENVIKPLNLNDLEAPLGGSKPPPGSKIAVYEVDGSGKRALIYKKAGLADDPSADPFQDNPRAIELVAISKLWGGQCIFYDKQEREAVLKFLRSKSPAQVQQIKETFEELLNPEQRKQYNQGSPIYTFFHPKEVKKAA